MPKAVMVVQSRPSTAEREDEYNKWYDETHVPELCELPGIVSARRFRLSGTQGVQPDPSTHEYLAIYEIEVDDLQKVVDALNAGVGGGSIHMTDAIELDPLPSVAIYEQL